MARRMDKKLAQDALVEQEVTEKLIEQSGNSFFYLLLFLLFLLIR